MERAERLGAHYNAEFSDTWVPAHRVEDRDQEERILRVFRDGDVEDFEKLKVELQAPSVFVPNDPVSREICETDLLEIIKRRGVVWLDRALEVAEFEASTLYGLAIAEDCEHTEDIRKVIARRYGAFKFDRYLVVDAVAGHEDSVARLNKWAPKILGQDFTENMPCYEELVGAALGARDEALRDALYAKLTPEALMGVIFHRYGLFLYSGDSRMGEPAMVHVLDLVQDALRPLVLAEDARVEELRRNCMHVFRSCEKEPDPKVMMRLTRRAVKGAVL